MKINKKAGVQPIGRTEKLYSHFMYQKVSEIKPFSSCASKQTDT